MAGPSLYVFATSDELRMLASCGIPELQSVPVASPADLERRSAIGFDRGTAIAFAKDSDGPESQACFFVDPFLQPKAAARDPRRVLIWTIMGGCDVESALGWWDAAHAARPASGAQQDAQARLDAIILVFTRPATVAEQMTIVRKSDDPRATARVFVIGPRHRAESNGTVGTWQASWCVEVPRLIAALLSEDDDARNSARGVWAWSSVALELADQESKQSIADFAVGAMKRCMFPETVAWTDEVHAAIQKPAAAEDVQLAGVEPLWSEFEAWPTDAAQLSRLKSRIEIESAPWVTAFDVAGRAHRRGRDAYDLLEAYERSQSGLTKLFEAILSSENPVALLRGVAGKHATATEAEDSDKTLQSSWKKMLSSIKGARDERERLETWGNELVCARAHYPPFLWRMMIAASTVLFVGTLVAFSVARTPMRSFGNLLLICLLSAAGSLLGAGLVWWNERRAGQAGVRRLGRDVRAQENAIKEAARQSAAVVDGGIKSWTDWRSTSARWSCRMVASRLVEAIEICVERNSTILRNRELPAEVLSYRGGSTIVVTGQIRIPAFSGSTPDRLGEYRSMTRGDAQSGAVIVSDFVAELDARLWQYMAHIAGDSQQGFSASPESLQEAWSSVVQMLAGANHFDFPGLSVITAPNVEENPDRKTRVCLSSPSLKLEPDGAPGLVDLDNATETAAMDPAIALSGVIIRMVRISPGTTDGAWHLWKGS